MERENGVEETERHTRCNCIIQAQKLQTNGNNNQVAQQQQTSLQSPLYTN